MADTKIEWAEKTWNPVTGCTKISPGCANCYAERMAHRLQAMGQERYRNGFEVTCRRSALREPLRWKKSNRIFICSMADLFHDEVPDDFLDEVFGVILAVKIFNNHPDHNFMVLTKRADRMRKYFTDRSPAELLKAWAFATDWVTVDDGDMYFHEYVESAVCHDWDEHGRNSKGSPYKMWGYPEQLFPLSNLSLGVTAENQEQADKRIPVLLQIPAAKKFVSVEPMLSGVNLRNIPLRDGGTLDALKGIDTTMQCHYASKLDWVICGGESGPGARPVHPDWVRSLRDQCRAAGTPFLFKQQGEWSWDLSSYDGPELPPERVHWIWPDGTHKQVGCGEISPGNVLTHKVGKKKAGRLLDGQLHDEYPNI